MAFFLLVIFLQLAARVHGAANGVVFFGNYSPANGIDYPVLDTDGSTPLSGSGYSIQVYRAAAGTTDPAGFAATGVVLDFSAAPFGGLVSEPQVTEITGIGIGSMAALQLRAWNNRGGSVTRWEDADIRGESIIFDSPALGDRMNPTKVPFLTGLGTGQFQLRAASVSEVFNNLGNAISSLEVFGSGGAVAQSITTSNYAHALESLHLRLANDSTNAAVISVEFRDDAGGEPGSILESWPEIGLIVQSPQFQLVDFVSTNGIKLQALTRYWIVVHGVSGGPFSFPVTADASGTGTGSVGETRSGSYPTFTVPMTKTPLLRVQGMVEPSLRITEIRSGGSVVLELLGKATLNHTIQYSSNLVQWLPLMSVTTDGAGAAGHEDTNAAGEAGRVYRAAENP